MATQEKKNMSDLLLLVLAISSAVIILDWCWRAQLLTNSLKAVYEPVFHSVKPSIAFLRVGFLAVLAAEAYLSQKRILKEVNRRPIYFIAAICIPLFIRGYDQHIWFNMFVYPLAFIGASASITILISQLSKAPNSDKDILARVSTGKKSEISISIPTDKGDLLIPNPRQGIGIEGNAGAGKSNLTERILWEMTMNGWAGFLYDYEGNTLEGRADLSKVIYTALKHCPKNHPVKFAMLNPTDPFGSVKTNPLSPKYLSSQLDVITMANGLMKNLEKEWVSKTDFWASNAINVVQGTTLYLWKKHPRFCTIPHLVTLLLNDFRAIMNLLSSDAALEPIMAPVISSYKMKAQATTGSIISTSQLPLTKLFVPEIFYLFNPSPEEEFDLDITNKQNPSIFCVANNPSQNAALGPVLALVATTCKNQMMRANKWISFFCVDENSTIFIPDQHELPGQGRKNGITSIFTWQTFSQMVDNLGDKKADMLRENLGTFFLGQNKNKNSSEYVSLMMGEYFRSDLSVSHSDSGESQTESQKREKLLTPSDIMLQPTGHYTGVVANGTPPRFHAQLDLFECQKMSIPLFSKNVNTGDEKNDREILKSLIAENFKQVQEDIRLMLEPFMPHEEIK